MKHNNHWYNIYIYMSIPKYNRCNVFKLLKIHINIGKYKYYFNFAYLKVYSTIYCNFMKENITCIHSVSEHYDTIE